MAAGLEKDWFVPGPYVAHTLLRARDWQDRPQLGRLCDWWCKGPTGVLALVGIGGAGKTAIVERFLRLLPGALPALDSIPKRDTLPPVQNLFIFSFYDAPNPDLFFAELYAWLSGQPSDESAKTPSYQQTVQLLSRVAGVNSSARILLVLDGLEKIQDDGARGSVFGQLLDRRLSDLVRRIGAGSFPNVVAIITTRFTIADLEEAYCEGQAPHYCSVIVDKIPDMAGMQLLRQRGVHGNDGDLRRILKECGQHALTVDLAGGWLTEFAGGDSRATLSLGTPAEMEGNIRKEPDASRRAILRQGYRFARISLRYREALARSDPAALAVMERACLFRPGATADTLALIFTGDGKTEISGPHLAALSSCQIEEKLRMLAQMRLLEASELCPHSAQVADQRCRSYSVHPAIRDGFLSTLDVEVTRRTHSAVVSALAGTLGERPSLGAPVARATLDLFEEIIHHALESGQADVAWHVYKVRLGGYAYVGWYLGEYDRGQRICSEFEKYIELRTRDQLLDRQRLVMAPVHLGWYLMNLGRAIEARRHFTEAISRAKGFHDIKNESVANQYLGHLYLISGRLGDALEFCERAVELASDPEANHAEGRNDTLVYRAFCRLMRGEVDAARNDFTARIPLQGNVVKGRLVGLPGVWYAMFLARTGRVAEAIAEVHCNREWIATRLPEHREEVTCDILLAELGGQEPNRIEVIENANTWAVNHEAQELACWCALVRGRLCIEEGRRHNAEAEDDEALVKARSSLDEGMRIAHECGYGILHIDLLLESTRLYLLCGEPQRALNDLRVALDDAIHTPTESRHLGLLAATDPACGYTWGIAEGQHLGAQANLLQAAQILGRAEFAPAKIDALPGDVRSLIDLARTELEECRELRKRIQDPRVKDTEQVLKDLDGGVLTPYPLRPLEHTPPAAAEPSGEEGGANRSTNPQFDVFLSHNSKDKPAVRQLAQAIKDRGLNVWLDEWELVPGRPWQEALEEIIRTARSAAVLVGADGLGPWEIPEMRACLSEFVDRDMPVIPVLMPGTPTKPILPLFLKQFTWVDLRSGLTKDGLDQLEWGITGKKPRS